MALDRLLPVSTTPGAVTGDSYMDAVQEEVTGLWDRSTITLTAVAGTNTITATATPAMTGGLGGNMNFILKPAATNTSSVTLNVNGGGAVAVVDAEGTALVAGALRINGNYLLHYDSGISKYVIVNYTPAATIVQGTVLIKTQAASASSVIDFVNGVSSVVLDDTYDAYELIISTLKPANDDVEIWLRVGTGGGPTYQTAGYQYFSAGNNTGNTTVNTVSASDAKIVLGTSASATAAVGNATGENFMCSIRFNNPESLTDFLLFQYAGAYNQAVNSATVQFTGAGHWSTSGTAITAIRVMAESGNITSGRFSLYGKTKA